jgi:NAD+ synthase (glutamine-hydrolysing)
MKIALCQFNPVVGAIDENAKRLIQFATLAHASGAELIIAPELAICGYPPKDLLFHPEFSSQVTRSLDFIAENSPNPFLLGAPVARGELTGQPFWNAAVLCHKKTWAVVSKKQLLPNYDVFDERRYFEPATEPNLPVEIGSFKFGITICEEAWNDATFFTYRRYSADPMSDRASAGADILINIAASPFSLGKPAFREKMLAHAAKRHQLPLLMCGQVGGIDQILFDGSTVAIDATGRTLARLAPFQEGMLMVHLEEQSVLTAETEVAPALENYEWMRQALVCGISDYFRKCKAKGAIIGLSGGIDSALTATLAVQALGADNVLGVRMPSTFSSTHSLEDAKALADNLGIKLKTIEIEAEVALLRKALGPVSDITDQNLQSRVRGLLLMALSNESGYLVLATGNKSELSVGYCTLYGDMCGALAPLGDVYKSDVWPLARHLNACRETIPTRSIEKVPSAELKENQSDQDSLPPYEQLDAILRGYMESPLSVDEISTKTGLPLEHIQDVIKMVHRSEYKRSQSPQILMLCDRVFGQGRRFPIAHQFDPAAK